MGACTCDSTPLLKGRFIIYWITPLQGKVIKFPFLLQKRRSELWDLNKFFFHFRFLLPDRLSGQLLFSDCYFISSLLKTYGYVGKNGELTTESNIFMKKHFFLSNMDLSIQFSWFEIINLTGLTNKSISYQLKDRNKIR